MKLCSVCDKKHLAKGYCRTHYERAKQGKPLDDPIRQYMKGDDLQARLDAYAPPLSDKECWLWTGGLSRGHGTVWVGGSQRGAHCVSWELFNKQVVPDGMVVRHKCDVGHCVNPHHLELGTQLQNIKDMHERGRYVSPEGFRHRTKRERAQIIAIAKEGVSYAAIGRIFGCSRQTVSRIVNAAK